MVYYPKYIHETEMEKGIENAKEHREPLAIIGIGLRLPMESNNVEEFWKNLINGTDGITRVPNDRWNSDYFTNQDINKAGKIANCSGSFIKGVNGFDNEFFNLSPYLCHQMDPQQRLILEVTYEALEDAGLKLKDVSGSDTSVYVGSFHYDYYVMCLQTSARDRIGSQVILGTSLTSLSNRISYHFNLKGPSVTVDTACSASLVGFHHACQSIWNGEAKMAIAGGVNVILRPETSIMLSKGGFLGPSGLCKAFDESADGYVRGEGVAIIIIKPLQKALENNDRIYALVEGTAINHDGYKTEGYTVPNIEAQTTLLSSLYNKTGISPAEVDYIECHGTGTKVGDPIEIAALNQVIGQDRNKDCYIGSVKTNIGHLEGAAGITAVIKTALILMKKCIPPNLHFNNPRSDLNLQRTHFVVSTEVIQLNKKGNKPILAGVNGFGAGGANAHAVLSEFIPDKYIKKNEKMNIISNRICLLFLLSHKSESSLKSTAVNYIQYLKQTTNNIIDICYTLMKRRSILSNQLLITAYSKDEIIDLLQEYIQGKTHPQIYTKQVFSDANVNNSPGKLAFVFSGQGGQWIGMSRQLMDEIPLFQSNMLEIDSKFKLLTGWSFIDELNNLDETTTRINNTEVVQPLLMAIQISLTYIWNEYFGVKPDGVIGHSVGEVAAAYCSGSIDLDTAIFIIYHRSLIQNKLSGRGQMLAVGISEFQANQLIEKFDHKISIATMNGPRMLTVAGDSVVLNSIAKELETQHIFNAFVKTQVPYHTSIMEEIKEEMIDSLKNITTNKPNIELYSSVTATKSHGIDGEYWYENVRKPVLFVQTIEKMINDGYRQFIEIGPHPILISGIKQLFNDLKINDNLAICSIKRKSETVQLYQNLGIYYIYNAMNSYKTADLDLYFQNFLPNAEFVFDLPHNTWDHKYFSLETNEDKQERLGFKYYGDHPFLRKDYQFHSIKNYQIWEANINMSNATYLVDHVVDHAIVFPAVGYIELAYAVARQQQQEKTMSDVNESYCFVENIQFETAIILPEEKMKSIITRLEIISPERDFIIYTKSQQQEDAVWNRHATGKINLTDQFIIKTQPKFHEIINEFDDFDLINIDEFYSFVNNCGLTYGKYFQGIKQLWHNDSKILSKVTLSEDIHYEGKQYHLHPALFDEALHGLFAENLKNGINELYLPHSLERVIIYKTGFTTVYAYIEVSQCSEEYIKSDTWIYDEDGELIAELYGLTSKNLSKTHSGNILHDTYEYQWIQKSFSVPTYTSTDTTEPVKISSDLILVVDDFTNLVAQQLLEKLAVNINYRFINTKMIDELTELEDIVIANQCFLFIIYIPSLSTQNSRQLDLQQKAVKYLSLVKLIQRNTNGKYIKLRLITHNSSSLPRCSNDNGIKFDHILLCGMCRVIQNEYPEWDAKFIDIAEEDSNSIDLIFDDLFNIKSNLQDNEIMYRNGTRYARSLTRLDSDKIDGLLAKQLNAVGSYYQLELQEKGIIDSFVFRQVTRQPLLANEIEIEVHAAGINFKDIFNLLGRLSDKAVKGSTAGNNLGLEVSGIVRAKGLNVNNFDIGDEVIAGLGNGFSGRIITSYTNCMKKPKCFSHVQGATIPISYVTAYYSLKHLARITSEDTILIHSATGGLGIACINVAKHFGAKIIATVGSKSKREFLEKEFAIKPEYIFDSHSTKFYHGIMNMTNGQGVDIIVNSLSGTLLDQSIKCLNSFGKFIEVGKVDIYENKPLCLERFGNNISYFVVDLDRVNNQKPILHKQMMDELHILFEQGHLRPLPYTEYAINQISSAFKYMMSGNHIGKLVVNMENQIVTALPPKKLMLSTDGVFIITGGTNGLGLMMAKWIAEKGISKLVLVSRNGIKCKRDQQVIDELKSRGILIDVKKIDIKSDEEVEKLFSYVHNNVGIIQGIVHSAAILSDSTIEKMDPAQFLNVIQTKAIGALNLHNISIKYSSTIQYFIMFSSIASTIGISGQINYAAANYFLDMLAEYRYNLNLPSTSINLGLLGEYAGMSKSRNDRRGVGNILINQGILKMPWHLVKKQLELAILHESPSRVTAILDWNRLRQSFPSISVDSRFSDIINNETKDMKKSIRSRLRDKIIEVKEISEAVEILKHEISLIFSRVLSLSGNNIAMDQPIDRLGFDSLSYTQIKTWLLKNLDISYPIIKLMKGLSIQSLAEELTENIKFSINPSEFQVDTNDQSSKTKYSYQESKPQTTYDEQQRSFSKPATSTLREEKENILSKNTNDSSVLGAGKSTHHNQTESVSVRIPRSSLSLMHAHVLGIGTSNPSIINYTTEVFENIKSEYVRLGITESDLTKVTSFYENCGIDKKYCHADFSKKTFTQNTAEEYFNEKYKYIAPQLAFEAASKAIEDWGGDVKTITHVVSCSCTGVLIPDINYLLIKELGLNDTIERISVNMMGCFGGLTTMKTAKALALQNPNYRILMVCTEVCSIHYRPLLYIDTMLACCIFGDGSAAMIIGCSPTKNEKPIYEIIQTGAHHIPDTTDFMSWNLNHDGWLIGLSPSIPLIIGDTSLAVVENFLKTCVSFPISLNNCDWLIHPGGKNILLNLQDALNIPYEKNIASWNILKNYGNMSSSTVLFVMDDARKRAPKEEFSISLAFGPGLSIELALLRKL